MERFYNENGGNKNISLKSYPAGFRFILQGEKIRNIYIIKDGITKCFISEENGKNFIIEFLGKGEVVGELEALKKIDCLCNIETITEVTAYAIPDYFFLKLVDGHNEFTKILLQELSTRIIQTSSRASFQQLYNLEYALLKLLKIQKEEQISISKDDMAAYLGISVRSFNRTLQQLKSKNLVNSTEFKILLEKLN